MSSVQVLHRPRRILPQWLVSSSSSIVEAEAEAEVLGQRNNLHFDQHAIPRPQSSQSMS